MASDVLCDRKKHQQDFTCSEKTFTTCKCLHLLNDRHERPSFMINGSSMQAADHHSCLHWCSDVEANNHKTTLVCQCTSVTEVKQQQEGEQLCIPGTHHHESLSSPHAHMLLLAGDKNFNRVPSSTGNLSFDANQKQQKQQLNCRPETGSSHSLKLPSKSIEEWL